jgi:hypothetical protein
VVNNIWQGIDMKHFDSSKKTVAAAQTGK